MIAVTPKLPFTPTLHSLRIALIVAFEGGFVDHPFSNSEFEASLPPARYLTN